MRTRIPSVIVAGLLLSSAAAPVSAQNSPVLTLGQAVKEALAKNDRMLNQRDTTEQADLGMRLARNAFTPKIVPNIFGSFAVVCLGGLGVCASEMAAPEVIRSKARS